jgi:RNA polymerase sigma-70 factor, ECF subfamily
MQQHVELIEKARSGDEAAFNELVTAYRRRVLGIVARLIGSSEDVEDVAQDVFLRMFFSLNQLSNPAMFDAWLYRLTVNAAYDFLRRKRRRKEARMSDLSEAQMVLVDADASMLSRREEERRNAVTEEMNSLLSEISEDDRILLLLKEVEGLSIKELEEVYGARENALKVRLFRARQKVLKVFARRESEKSDKLESKE